ncbi:Segregation and condensation protein A [hydrothermal vent metagenome]|uniref:Segregation and condensation protein A n=1 Tax=hydrothermal vent metagenome TaxID=652676 RepID=A0A3B0YEN9_9ZZZZ
MTDPNSKNNTESTGSEEAGEESTAPDSNKLLEDSAKPEDTDDKSDPESIVTTDSKDGEPSKSTVNALAKVRGLEVTELPKDLYIPPDALEVFLDHFEGPLDLLLYLIRKQNLDILDIPIVEITKQYMSYIDLMSNIQFELASEYLLMAAMLAEIKSRMLLPRPESIEEEEQDPRADLVRRLQEYERFKQAAEDFDGLDRVGRDTFPISADVILPANQEKPLPPLEMEELLKAFGKVLKRAEMYTHHQIEMDALSVRERMSNVLDLVKSGEFIEFSHLFDVTEGRMGVVVTFLAILELIKESLLELVQSEPFAQIYVKAIEGDKDEVLVEYDEESIMPRKPKRKKKD